MVKGETVMPTPEGAITSTETWGNTDAVNNQAVEETQEDITPEASDATEQAVVKGSSKLQK
jgi:hypothetical protein